MMKKIFNKTTLLFSIFGLLILGVSAYLFVPSVQMHLGEIITWMRGSVNPAGELPVADSVVSVQPSLVLTGETSTAQKISSERSVQTPAAILSSAILPPPAFDPKNDYQDWNNCGPATLALGLRFWGWNGDQTTISAVVKPERQDKNVNVEELAWYVNQNATDLQAEFRVGGDLSVLKKLINAGFPVIIEESFALERPAWPGDDLWAAHYLLLTGYDDAISSFTSQDSYYGPNKLVKYEDLSIDWQSFNHLYLVIFPRERQQQIQTLLGNDWQVVINHQRNIAALQNQIKLGRGNAYTWFNLGTSFTALENFQAASSAFKTARQLGLPQRMLRYQFGPLVTAYRTGDLSDLTELTDFSLQITPDSEEALLWKGWGYILAGDKQRATTFFYRALQANQNYKDAEEALKEINSL